MMLFLDALQYGLVTTGSFLISCGKIGIRRQ